MLKEIATLHGHQNDAMGHINLASIMAGLPSTPQNQRIIEEQHKAAREALNSKEMMKAESVLEARIREAKRHGFVM